MRRLPLLLAVGLAACGPMTLNPTKREFWLGGTDDKEIREKAAPIIAAAHEEATKQAVAFLGCMSQYGRDHAQSARTATEVAEAGVATCQRPLDAAASSYAREMEYGCYSDVGAKPESAQCPSFGIEATRPYRAGLLERGRQATIKAMVDTPAPQP